MRWRLIMIIIGGFLAYYGFREYQVSRHATAEPIEISLMDLENGKAPGNNHVRIGDHVAVYSYFVASVSASSLATDEKPNSESAVHYCYYPVMSREHPFWKRFHALAVKYKNNIPQRAELPLVGNFAVLVKTSRFEKLGDIPKGQHDEDSVTGLFVQQIATLDAKERELLLQNLQGANLDNVLILQEGRTPAPMGKWMGLMSGGGILILTGLLWMVAGARSAGRDNYLGSGSQATPVGDAAGNSATSEPTASKAEVQSGVQPDAPGGPTSS